MRSAALLSVLLLAATAGPAIADNHNSNADINFGADHMELQDKQNRVILTGNVKVTQAEMTLTAARMTVAYSGKALSGNGTPQASRVDATGNVVVTRPGQVARAAYGIYDVNRRVVIMLGGVTLTQGPNTVSGSRLTINLDSGRAVIDGSGTVSGGGKTGPGATTTAPSGRVTGRFTVPKRDATPAK